jgi:methionine--tRNA ligase beta chain
MTGATTAVTSHAAVCQLTVAQSLFDKDIVLQVVAKTVSDKQLSLKLEKKGNNNALELLYGAVTLQQRNSVVRALCGRAVHYALDQAPHYLLAGTAAVSSSSPAAAVTAGSIVAWMSVADSMRNSTTHDDDTTALLESLETHLTTKTFLCVSCQCTVADWDLAVALLQKMGHDADTYGVHTQRWLRQSLACLEAAATMAGADKTKIPAGLPDMESPMPVFFYGSEDPAAVLQPTNKQANKSGGSKQQLPAKKKDGKAPQQQQQQQEKKEKKQPAKGGGGGGNQEPADFTVAALDIRVGKIVKVWEHESADKLFCEEIDLGTETRQIASGLRPFYKADDLQDRHVLVLCNLKSRNLVGFASHGMVLCASNADHTAVEIVVPPAGATLGERVQFDGFAGEPEPENKVAKKKVFEKVAPDLKTDETGQVVWKGSLAKTSAGVVKAINGMSGAQVS